MRLDHQSIFLLRRQALDCLPEFSEGNLRREDDVILSSLLFSRSSTGPAGWLPGKSFLELGLVWAKKISMLFSTPGGGRFSRAAPFVVWKSSDQEIARFQPFSRFWDGLWSFAPWTLLDLPKKGRVSPCHPSQFYALFSLNRLLSVPDSKSCCRKSGVMLQALCIALVLCAVSLRRRPGGDPRISSVLESPSSTRTC